MLYVPYPDLAKSVVKISSANQVAITKMDTLFKGAAGVRNFDDLPGEAKVWIGDIEQKLRVPVTLIGTGADASDMIDRRAELL